MTDWIKAHKAVLGMAVSALGYASTWVGNGCPAVGGIDVASTLHVSCAMLTLIVGAIGGALYGSGKWESDRFHREQQKDYDYVTPPRG